MLVDIIVLRCLRPDLKISAESVRISLGAESENLLSARPHKELTAIRFMVVPEMFSEMCILHITEAVFLLLVGDRLTVVSPLHLAFLVVQSDTIVVIPRGVLFLLGTIYEMRRDNLSRCLKTECRLCQIQHSVKGCWIVSAVQQCGHPMR